MNFFGVLLKMQGLLAFWKASQTVWPASGPEVKIWWWGGVELWE